MRNAMQQDVNRMRKTLKDAVFPLKDPHGMGGINHTVRRSGWGL